MLDRNRFFADWAANAGALAMLAVSGIAINSLIAKIYGAAALGVFNQVFAIFILMSQLATLGTQFSILRFVPEYSGDREMLARILGSACLVVAIGATLAVGLVYSGFLVAGGALYGPDVAHGVTLMLPGLWFFAANKLLLNALNGIEANRTYALLVALRYLLMAVTLLIAIALGGAGNELSVILSVSEALLFLAVLGVCCRMLPVFGMKPTRRWIETHVRFGSRSMLGGIAVELNTRADVLVLGIFVSAAAVGVYSFAAFFIEGALQFAAIGRRIVDPVLAKLFASGRLGDLAELLRRGRNFGALFNLAVYGGSAAAYPWFASLLADPAIARASWPVYAVLAVGASVYGAYAAFGGVFSQAGQPGLQSRFNIAILATNAALGFVLAPLFQVTGAAVATSLSFLLGTLYFRRLVNRHLGVAF